MKKRVMACTSILMLAVAMVGFAAPPDSDYPAMMKSAVAARGALNMAIMMMDWPTVATQATNVQNQFKAIEDFWTKRGNSQDAIGFAANIEKAAAATHDAAVAGTSLRAPARRPGAGHVFHLYVVRAPQRDAVQARLRALGVATGIHYPTPVHQQPAYRGRAALGPSGCRQTEAVACEVLSLPLYPELTDVQVEQVCSALRAL